MEAETSTTWVNPDGTLTTDLAASPVREQVDGSWQNVDPDLVAAPQGVTAKVGKIAATFSAGGSQPLYSVACRSGGEGGVAMANDVARADAVGECRDLPRCAGRC